MSPRRVVDLDGCGQNINLRPMRASQALGRPAYPASSIEQLSVLHAHLLDAVGIKTVLWPALCTASKRISAAAGGGGERPVDGRERTEGPRRAAFTARSSCKQSYARSRNALWAVLWCRALCTRCRELCTSAPLEKGRTAVRVSPPAVCGLPKSARVAVAVYTADVART